LEPRFEDKDVRPGKIYLYRVCASWANGQTGPGSGIARTQPRVAVEPVVSVLAADRIEVGWKRHPAPDVVGYNVYRGLVKVRTVTEGKTGKWVDNDPKYDQPMPVFVRDIMNIRKLNDEPLAETKLVDAEVDLNKPGPASAGYKHKVYAYIVRAVNRLGVESGPSPYALSFPSAPQHVLCRSAAGGPELKWGANPEKGITGYHVYRMSDTYTRPRRLTESPVKGTRYADKTKRRSRYFVVAVDGLGQEGEPSAPVWFGHTYKGFYEGEWHP
jgi:hypothetical protein